VTSQHKLGSGAGGVRGHDLIYPSKSIQFPVDPSRIGVHSPLGRTTTGNGNQKGWSPPTPRPNSLNLRPSRCAVTLAWLSRQPHADRLPDQWVATRERGVSSRVTFQVRPAARPRPARQAERSQGQISYLSRSSKMTWSTQAPTRALAL
jgi:hypothetical protein